MTSTEGQTRPHNPQPFCAKRKKGSAIRGNTVRTRNGGQKALRYGRKLAIQLMCTECLGWESDPKGCTSTMCPLFPFRGKTLRSQR